MFEVVLAPEARKFYENADHLLAKKLARCFVQLEKASHRHSAVKRLTGALAGKWRYRIEDWRVIFRVADDEARVVVLLIAHRSEVYD